MVRWVEPDEMRSKYIEMLTDQFQEKFLDYGVLSDLVRDINNITLIQNTALYEQLIQQRERHFFSQVLCAHYVLNNAEDLEWLRRIFAIIGLFPVGFYQLGSPDFPLPSTLFRPLQHEAIRRQPFRILLSVRNLTETQGISGMQPLERLASRTQLKGQFIEFIYKFEKYGMLNAVEAQHFLTALMQYVHPECQSLSPQAWMSETTQNLNPARQNAFIGQMTLPCLNMEKATQLTRDLGLDPLDHLEAPSQRNYPILSNKMSILLKSPHSSESAHRCQFQIEQRGLALTAKGLKLVQGIFKHLVVELAQKTRTISQQRRLINQAFKSLPDSDVTLYRQGLAYFRFCLNPDAMPVALGSYTKQDVPQLLRHQVIQLVPIMFEDIVQPDLSQYAPALLEQHKKQFEAGLGCPVHDPMPYYALWQEESLQRCLKILNQNNHQAMSDQPLQDETFISTILS